MICGPDIRASGVSQSTKEFHLTDGYVPAQAAGFSEDGGQACFTFKGGAKHLYGNGTHEAGHSETAFLIRRRGFLDQCNVMTAL